MSAQSAKETNQSDKETKAVPRKTSDVVGGQLVMSASILSQLGTTQPSSEFLLQQSTPLGALTLQIIQSLEAFRKNKDFSGLYITYLSDEVLDYYKISGGAADLGPLLGDEAPKSTARNGVTSVSKDEMHDPLAWLIFIQDVAEVVQQKALASLFNDNKGLDFAKRLRVAHREGLVRLKKLRLEPAGPKAQVQTLVVPTAQEGTGTVKVVVKGTKESKEDSLAATDFPRSGSLLGGTHNYTEPSSGPAITVNLPRVGSTLEGESKQDLSALLQSSSAMGFDIGEQSVKVRDPIKDFNTMRKYWSDHRLGMTMVFSGILGYPSGQRITTVNDQLKENDPLASCFKQYIAQFDKRSLELDQYVKLRENFIGMLCDLETGTKNPVEVKAELRAMLQKPTGSEGAPDDLTREAANFIVEQFDNLKSEPNDKIALTASEAVAPKQYSAYYNMVGTTYNMIRQNSIVADINSTTIRGKTLTEDPARAKLAETALTLHKWSLDIKAKMPDQQKLKIVKSGSTVGKPTQ